MISEDGIVEMIDDFNGGKIQYAGARVTDPNTNLPKIVFINWVSILITIQFILMLERQQNMKFF